MHPSFSSLNSGRNMHGIFAYIRYLQHLATPTSYFSFFHSVVPTFQYPRHRSQPPVFSANSLRWPAAHCDKMLSYDRFIQGKRWKSQEAKSGRIMVGDQTLPIENSSGASSLQLQYAAEYCREEGQYLRTTFLVACSKIKESNYSTHSTFGGRLYCFRHVYGFTTRSKLTSAMCRDGRAF